MKIENIKIVVRYTIALRIFDRLNKEAEILIDLEEKLTPEFELASAHMYNASTIVLEALDQLQDSFDQCSAIEKTVGSFVAHWLD